MLRKLSRVAAAICVKIAPDVCVDWRLAVLLTPSKNGIGLVREAGASLVLGLSSHSGTETSSGYAHSSILHPKIDGLSNELDNWTNQE